MELIIEKLLCFALVLTRVSAFFLIVPVFGSTSVPQRVKISTIIILTIFLMSAGPASASISDTSPLEAFILLCCEASYGFCLGLVAAVLFSVVMLYGRIVERQMGMAMAEVMDPLTNERAQPLGLFVQMVFFLLFLSANGHHILLTAIFRSYDNLPIGTVPDISVMTEAVVRSGSTMLTAGLRLAAPILAAFIVLMVALAVMARVAPEMNILFISMPLRVGLGILMLAIFFPYLNSFVSEFAEWMSELLPI